MTRGKATVGSEAILQNLKNEVAGMRVTFGFIRTQADTFGFKHMTHNSIRRYTEEVKQVTVVTQVDILSQINDSSNLEQNPIQVDSTDGAVFRTHSARKDLH